jgi:hypothetical protein
MGHALDDWPLPVRLQKRIEKYQLAHRSSPLSTDVELQRQSVSEIAKLTAELRHASMQIKELDLMFGRHLVAMRSAVIEQERGKGVEVAMVWIFNTLSAPGQLPPEDATDAQAYFDKEIEPIDAGMQQVMALFHPELFATKAGTTQ